MNKTLAGVLLATTILSGCTTVKNGAAKAGTGIKNSFGHLGHSVNAALLRREKNDIRAFVLKNNPGAKEFPAEYFTQFESMPDYNIKYAFEESTLPDAKHALQYDLDGDGKPETITIESRSLVKEWKGDKVENPLLKRNTVHITYSSGKQEFVSSWVGPMIVDAQQSSYTLVTPHPGMPPQDVKEIKGEYLNIGEENLQFGKRSTIYRTLTR